MADARMAVVGLVGVAFLAAGFLIGTSMGDGREASAFGSGPVTLTIDPSGVRIPKYAAQKSLPALAVTGGEVATTEAGEPESLAESPTVAPASEEKAPIKTSPSKVPSPEPEITVGEEEEKKKSE